MADIQLRYGFTARWEDGALVIMANDVGLQTRLDNRNLFIATVRVMRRLHHIGATQKSAAVTTRNLVDFDGRLEISQAHEALNHLRDGGLVECNQNPANRSWWLTPEGAARKAGNGGAP